MRTDNPTAIALYERNGYQRFAFIRDYYEYDRFPVFYRHLGFYFLLIDHQRQQYIREGYQHIDQAHQQAAGLFGGVMAE